MVIKIKKLTMQNFKGVLGERTIEFSPSVTQVLGANRSGKTTIADAFRWCLFGENSEGRKQFGVRTYNANKEVIPDLPHSVTVVLDVDGSTVELQRHLVEKWTKVRGSSDERTLSLPTHYYVNGQKYSEGDYNSYVDSLCHKSLFLCITNPSYFPSLRADEQRALLTKMVSVPTNEELAAGNTAFTQLLQDMADTTLEKYLQHVGYDIKQIKDELQIIPVRIEEQEGIIAKLTEGRTDWAAIEAEIAATDNAIERVDDELADLSKVGDGELQAKRKLRVSIAQMEGELADARGKHQRAAQQEAMAKSNKVQEARQYIEATKQRMRLLASSKADAEAALERVATLTEDFRARWAAVDAQEFVADPSKLECPTCHRPLEAEDQAQAIADMEAAFNRKQAAAYEELEREAKRIKTRKADAEAALASYEQSKAELDAKLLQYEQALEAAQAIELTGYEERVNFDEHIAHLMAEIANVQLALQQPSTAPDNTEAIASLKRDKSTLLAKRDALRDQLNMRNVMDNANKRIAVLMEQQRKLNEQLTELEGKEDAAKEFMLASINAVEERVNKLFTMVRFTMFDRKLNGSITPACECCVGGVPYSDLNTADRVNAGIDIINAICRHADMYVPCFIDNVESMNNVQEMASQCIHLIVSTDKELQVIQL